MLLLRSSNGDGFPLSNSGCWNGYCHLLERHSSIGWKSNFILLQSGMEDQWECECVQHCCQPQCEPCCHNQLCGGGQCRSQLHCQRYHSGACKPLAISGCGF